MESLRMQLKVCEGCGRLWFRTGSGDGVYGSCCAGKLAEHARAAALPRRAQRSKGHGLRIVRGGAR
jgi:hypothetical protein